MTNKKKKKVIMKINMVTKCQKGDTIKFPKFEQISQATRDCGQIPVIDADSQGRMETDSNGTQKHQRLK